MDQPEDDLDNRFISDEVVNLFRGQREGRQIITVTHNANIPVLAHADLVLGLEAESDQSSVPVIGGMDHECVQQEVRDVMEGGEDAFLRRAEKYGLGL